MKTSTERPDDGDALTALDAVSLSRLIHQRDLSCVEVMQAYLRRIERLNPVVNAIVSLQPEASLLEQARVRDAELASGVDHGWMHGFPLAVKDLALTRGIRTTFGSPLFADFVPDQDAIVVERMKAAGAIVIGKTNVPEFGLGSQSYNPIFGATGCAFDPSKTAGGSSGGAAAALALDMLPVADGSDMMGSLRNPAAFNAVVGFRPSQGRVPAGHAPDLFFNQLSTEGPMGRTVADVAHLLAIQAGRDLRAPLSLDGDGSSFIDLAPVNAPRFGWLGDYDGYLPMDPGVMALCESSFPAFEQLGGSVTGATVRFDMASLWTCWCHLRQFAVSGVQGAAFDDPNKRALMKPELQWEVEQGLSLSVRDVQQASVVRSQWYRAMCRLFEQFDFLLLPSAQVFPFDRHEHWPKVVGGRRMDTYHRWMEGVIGASLAGLPVISVPVGFNAAGLPMGISIIGPPRADREVLAVAAAYEREVGGFRQRRPGWLG
ncbi:amidase [Pseudomonas matsuisoli]|uniref:Amidase n=1 Tax=Pseudomonas matsuisoli TaxID=1515666 RepID=A0A917PHN5_9PSED|nr:amidase [Pseudomonas matsuisoli]GGJ78861.1 amidase [Pseudomonas matsuisoli]